MGGLSSPLINPEEDAQRLRRAFFTIFAFIALLWAIKLVEIGLGTSLARFGIYPLSVEGALGIALAPMLHGSVPHLLANTAPILVLGTALLYGYPSSAPWVLGVVYLGAGVGVWLFARPAYHLGASGLTFGMLTFLFTMGVLRWDRRAIALALGVFLLYGSMIWGIFPTAPDVSFEYHFFGASLGAVLAVLLRRQDPPPMEQKYSWEVEEQTEDWPFESGPTTTTGVENEEERRLH